MVFTVKSGHSDETAGGREYEKLTEKIFISIILPTYPLNVQLKL